MGWVRCHSILSLFIPQMHEKRDINVEISRAFDWFLGRLDKAVLRYPQLWITSELSASCVELTHPRPNHTRKGPSAYAIACADGPFPVRF